MPTELGHFSNTIFKRTYAFTPEETWDQCALRVAKFVAQGNKELEAEFYWAISNRKFIPGGRYLYSAGRELANINNCFLLRAEDSREGWGELLKKHTIALATGGGVGTDYSNLRPKGTPIKRYGGTASGPTSLMQMVNEVARHVQAGGSRRSALWAGLVWSHPDLMDFIKLKNWSTDIKALKEKDFSFPAPLDMTNVSVNLNDDFFKYVNKESDVWNLYYSIVKIMCKTGEPGFAINLKEKSNETLRNPCQPSWATILTPHGISTIGEVKIGDTIWSGKRWTKIVNKWSTGIKSVLKYSTSRSSFTGTSTHRILEKGNKIEVDKAISIDSVKGSSEFNNRVCNIQDIMDGLVLGDGSVHKASNNLVYLIIGNKDQDYFNSEISSLIIKERPGLNKKAYEIYTSITHEELPRTWDRIIPERYFANSNKLVNFLRGLYSANGSVTNSHTHKTSRIQLKQSSYKLITQVQLALSSLGISSYITTTKPTMITHHNGDYLSKPSYSLNISLQEDIERFYSIIGFIHKYKIPTYSGIKDLEFTSKISKIESLGFHEVYDIEVNDPDHTYWTDGSLVSNCNEVVSESDSDCCNLGSIVLPRIEDIKELKRVVRLGTRFLYMGTSLGFLPHEDFYKIRAQNKRIGLGIMGLHDWCLKQGIGYEPSGELGKWLSCWANISDDEAEKCSNEFSLPFPKGRRAIAPTGTIGIIGETSTGIEPVFCVAYKRRFLDSGKYKFSYIIDPTAEKAINEYGIHADDIEDAYKLATNVERRLAMQAFVQDFTDQAISSTINMPEWGETGNNNAKQFAEILLKYLPRLRGITVYPDGARAGQPITPVQYSTAKKQIGTIYEESAERCNGGVCGI